MSTKPPENKLKDENDTADATPKNDDESVDPRTEPVISPSGQQVQSADTSLNETENTKGASEISKSNIKVDNLKKRFEIADDAESEASDDIANKRNSESSTVCSIDVRATASKLKDIKFAAPSHVPVGTKKRQTPTSNIPPFIPPPVPIPPAPPMPEPAKEKKKSNYKGPKLKPVHWEGAKFTTETRAILDEAEQNDELLQLTDKDRILLQTTFAAETKKKPEPKLSTADKPESPKMAVKTDKFFSNSSVKKKPVLDLDIDTARKLEFFLRLAFPRQ